MLFYIVINLKEGRKKGRVMKGKKGRVMKGRKDKERNGSEIDAKHVRFEHLLHENMFWKSMFIFKL
jgi:hypothetical protein